MVDELTIESLVVVAVIEVPLLPVVEAVVKGDPNSLVINFSRSLNRAKSPSAREMTK